MAIDGHQSFELDHIDESMNEVLGSFRWNGTTERRQNQDLHQCKPSTWQVGPQCRPRTNPADLGMI